MKQIMIASVLLAGFTALNWWLIAKFPMIEIKNRNERGRYERGSHLYFEMPWGGALNALLPGCAWFFSLVWLLTLVFPIH